MARIGNLTVDLTLKSASFIRDLNKSSQAVATNTNAMRKSFDAVRQSATALVGGLAGLASVRAVRQLARLTEESLKLAAAMDGPLTDAAKGFLAESEKVSNAFQLGVAQGFLDSFNSSLLTTGDNLRSVNDLGASIGRVMGTGFALSLEAAKPFAEIVSQIATGLQYIATHTPGQALADLMGNQQIKPLDFNKMTAEVGSGVTAWDAYTQSVKRSGEQVTETAKTIQVAFPDVAKMHEQMRLQSIETTQQWLTVTDTVGKALGTMFKENKAVAIVQAVINTAQAITEALKLPFPINWAQVAAVTALGAAQIATIASAQPGSSKALKKSSGGGAGGSTATARAGAASRGSAAPGQTVTIKIVGDVFGPEHFRKIVAGINGVQRDGTALLAVA